MLVLERVFTLVTSLALVRLATGMTLSEDQRSASTMMAPADDQSEATSQMSFTQASARRYTESREVQEHINRLFTYAGQPLPTRPLSRAVPAPTTEVPRCATEHTYCTEEEEAVSDDISDAVNQLLGSSPAFRQQFNATDILTQEDKTIVERGPDDPNENHLCGFKVELTRVTWATSEDNVVMRIAQSKDFAQAVRLEHCTNEDCRCHEIFTSGLLRPYRARCKQKYVYRKLLALTEDGKKKLKLVTHNFPLPSCCSCVITKELNFRDGAECESESGLGERISPNDLPPPQEGNTTTRSKASRHHLWTGTLVVTYFIYSHFK